MKVVVCKSNLEELTDLPVEEASHCFALYIGAREQQIERCLGENILAIGWWGLMEAGYLNGNGTVNKKKFLEHDTVYFAEPARVYKRVRNTYKRLIEKIKEI